MGELRRPLALVGGKRDTRAADSNEHEGVQSILAGVAEFLAAFAFMRVEARLTANGVRPGASITLEAGTELDGGATQRAVFTNVDDAEVAFATALVAAHNDALLITGAIVSIVGGPNGCPTTLRAKTARIVAIDDSAEAGLARMILVEIPEQSVQFAWPQACFEVVIGPVFGD